MCEPTEAMIEGAGREAGIGDGGWTERADFTDEWSAAVDAALRD